MIIDFHTHTFPDAIAERSIAYLEQKGHIHAYREGTLASLKHSMRQSGIDICQVLPVATKPSQVPTINRLSYELNGRDGVYFAGAIHPDCEDVPGIMDEIASHGLKIVKLHPDYQETDFDDPRMINIMARAAERGLYIITHAGLDPAYPEHIHCTPDMVLQVLDELSGLIDNKLILAHLGGLALTEEVMDKLIGKPVYMDTAAVLPFYPAKAREIIAAHGADRILFATDSPWGDQADFVKRIRDYGFSFEDEEKIMWRNAARILGLNTL
ncbi:MAG: amidohydrolase family protein [Firmicutes bacterium]|nr:amidohydrolase family protein [Bacillota bacterium]